MCVPEAMDRGTVQELVPGTVWCSLWRGTLDSRAGSERSSAAVKQRCRWHVKLGGDRALIWEVKVSQELTIFEHSQWAIGKVSMRLLYLSVGYSERKVIRVLIVGRRKCFMALAKLEPPQSALMWKNILKGTSKIMDLRSCVLLSNV